MLDRYFDLAPDIGLTSYIAGDAGLADIQLQTCMDGLKVIVSGPAVPDSGVLVKSEKMRSLIKKMASEYDWVIVDTPSLDITDDALVFASYTDGRVLVVRSGKVGKYRFMDFLDFFKLADIPVTGVVLNRVPRHSLDLHLL